jgi:hypothetical protein
MDLPKDDNEKFERVRVLLDELYPTGWSVALAYGMAARYDGNVGVVLHVSGLTHEGIGCFDGRLVRELLKVGRDDLDEGGRQAMMREIDAV